VSRDRPEPHGSTRWREARVTARTPPISGPSTDSTDVATSTHTSLPASEHRHDLHHQRRHRPPAKSAIYDRLVPIELVCGIFCNVLNVLLGWVQWRIHRGQGAMGRSPPLRMPSRGQSRGALSPSPRLGTAPRPPSLLARSSGTVTRWVTVFGRVYIYYLSM